MGSTHLYRTRKLLETVNKAFGILPCLLLKPGFHVPPPLPPHTFLIGIRIIPQTGQALESRHSTALYFSLLQCPLLPTHLRAAEISYASCKTPTNSCFLWEVFTDPHSHTPGSPLHIISPQKLCITSLACPWTVNSYPLWISETTAPSTVPDTWLATNKCSWAFIAQKGKDHREKELMFQNNT